MEINAVVASIVDDGEETIGGSELTGLRSSLYQTAFKSTKSPKTLIPPVLLRKFTPS
jgi:hypothetical protein